MFIIPDCSFTCSFHFLGSNVLVLLLRVVAVIQGDWSLCQGIHTMTSSNLASVSAAFFLAYPGAPGLGIRRFAAEHVTVKEHERLVHQLEHLETEAIMSNRRVKCGILQCHQRYRWGKNEVCKSYSIVSTCVHEKKKQLLKQ